MGSSGSKMSKDEGKSELNIGSTTAIPSHDDDVLISTSSPPPQMPRYETTSEKVYRKFTQEPLVPIGVAATTYFLVSGIRAFQRRDTVRSQKMMRGRVAAQFFTLVCFIGYIGSSGKADWRLAPMYQDAMKQRKEEDAKKGT